MEYSVIVPVHNRAAQIVECVDGILNGSFPRDRYELLVVDNGSTDGTAAAAEAAGARVLRESRPNRCTARNRGAQEAKGRWLIFTDSDCRPDRNWLAALDAFISKLPEDSPVRLVAGRIDAATPKHPVEEYAALRSILDQKKFMTPGRVNSPPFAATANLAVRRDAFMAVDGFDPAMPPGEDADLCWRIAGAGGTLAYVPEAAVIHHHRATAGDLWRQTRGYGLAHARQFRKWKTEWGRQFWIEPCYYVWAVKGFLKSPWCWLRGRTPLEKRLGWYDGIANSGLILGRLEGSLREHVVVI